MGRIKEGFVLREVAGRNVVIATGEAGKEFHGMITLNATGCDTWNALAEGLSDEEMVQMLVRRYGVADEVAREDVASFVAKAFDEGFLA